MYTGKTPFAAIIPVISRKYPHCPEIGKTQWAPSDTYLLTIAFNWSLRFTVVSHLSGDLGNLFCTSRPFPVTRSWAIVVLFRMSQVSLCVITCLSFPFVSFVYCRQFASTHWRVSPSLSNRLPVSNFDWRPSRPSCSPRKVVKCQLHSWPLLILSFTLTQVLDAAHLSQVVH